MKKIKYILLTIATFSMLSSCEDAYKIVQAGELNETVAITSIDDMQSYLNGIYGQVTVTNELAFTSIFTDEVGPGKGSGGQNYDTHRFQITAANGFAEGLWYSDYSVINSVNRLLRSVNTNIPTPTDPTDLANYNSILAQARAIRAFAHFELLTYFSTDLTNDNALGVILMDRVPKVDEDLVRNTNGEVFAFIESDLAYAYDNVVDQVPSASIVPTKFVSKNMINALRARMYLYRGNTTLAQQYAQSVIAAAPTLTPATPVPSGTVGSTSWNSSFYGNSSTNPYRKLFNDTNTTSNEIIFALDRPAAGTWENVASNFTTNTTNAAGAPLFEVGRKLFNLLKATPGDVRRYANVDPTSIINPNYDTDPNYLQDDVIVIDKYPGKTVSGYPLRNDIKVFRMSEMYFILAECYAKTGNFNGASNSTAAVLKKIRDARNFLGPQPLPNYASQVDALKDILLERRLELCYEGHRYIDLKRLGSVVGQSIDRDATDDELTGMPLTISNTDYRFTLPIPTAEINANHVIQQNPGY